MRFVIASAYYSGLGFGMRLQEEGHDVLLAVVPPTDRRTAKRHRLVGNGILNKRSLTDVLAHRGDYRDCIFIWDENHSVAENECLRSEGFRVFLGGAHADRMEHDRAACLELVSQYGLRSPASYRFTSPADALRFLEAQDDVAFLLKPDRGETHETWLPQSAEPAEAKEELRRHLESLRSNGCFLLQERKDGVETNVEVWFVRGEPRFAFMTLESKRKLTGDLGDFCGCAFDFVFAIPLDCRAVTESVGRLFPLYRQLCFTGFGDANFIAARDGIWFFEKCERFGYNAHPNFFWNLNRAAFGDTIAAMVDGSFQPDVAPGFGASCTMYMDHAEPGKAVTFPETAARDLYFLDVYREGNALLTAGYNEAVAFANGFSYTIPTAWEACMKRAWEVKFAGRAFRVDGADTNYPSSPLRRYEALKAMDYI